MHFKHPEILYALFLLVIPIAIHLFNLRRFKKTLFTNVKFLKSIQLETRKSEHLKKWLLLLTRSLLFISLIVAFAQPYLSKKPLKDNRITFILDNSMSMQAKTNGEELLKSAIQQIINSTKASKSNFNLFTANHKSEDLNALLLKNELLKIRYTSNNFNLKNKINLASLNDSLNDKIIVVSDFQFSNQQNNKLDSIQNHVVRFAKVKPDSYKNFYIDTVFITKKTSENITIKTIIKSNQIANKNVSVSLENNGKLIGKATCHFENNKKNSVLFTFPNKNLIKGKLTLSTPFLSFDNTLYFVINQPKKINVFCIGKPSNALSSIFDNSTFNYSFSKLKNLNYSQLNVQQTIILNELDEISENLSTEIIKFVESGGNLIIIPNEKINLKSYNNLLINLHLGYFKSSISTQQELITKINAPNKLFDEVFNSNIKNFDYPFINHHLNWHFNQSEWVLKLQSDFPFLLSSTKNNSGIYVFTGAINYNNSNFYRSELIVPLFFNMATRNTANLKLYHTLPVLKPLTVNYSGNKSDLIKIKKDNYSFIPNQKRFTNKTTLNLNNQIKENGFYKLLIKDSEIGVKAFNYNRNESILKDLSNTQINYLNGLKIESLNTVLNKFKKTQKITSLFQWFLGFAILFLLIEVLLLKYYKL